MGPHNFGILSPKISAHDFDFFAFVFNLYLLALLSWGKVREIKSSSWDFAQNYEPYTTKHAFYEVIHFWLIKISYSDDILNRSETDQFKVTSLLSY